VTPILWIRSRFEIIDGQQRINALADFTDGAFKLFDPVKDEAEARFPEFIKRQPCPWAAKTFQDLDQPVTAAGLSHFLSPVIQNSLKPVPWGV
jgi:hypothetical protein